MANGPSRGEAPLRFQGGAHAVDVAGRNHEPRHPMSLRELLSPALRPREPFARRELLDVSPMMFGRPLRVRTKEVPNQSNVAGHRQRPNADRPD